MYLLSFVAMAAAGDLAECEIYIELEALIGKPFSLEMVAGRFDLNGFSTRSRKGLSNSNSSMTYPPMVPSENVTIMPSPPSFSTLSMCVSSVRVLSVMVDRISQCQFFDYSILLILVYTFWVRSRRSRQVSGAAGGLGVGRTGGVASPRQNPSSPEPGAEIARGWRRNVWRAGGSQ